MARRRLRSGPVGQRRMSGQVLNSACPWSGKPVASDSLTEYRGHRVGFCNPGCRDKFDGAKTAFDAAIDAPRPVGVPLALRGGADHYAPRRFRDEGVLALATSRFKFYLIEAGGDRCDAKSVKEAVLGYARTCPHVWKIDDSALGHVIVHRGQEAVWLLAQWWIAGGILRGLMARSPLGEFCFGPAEAGLIGCVWELQVVEHERSAWIRHMMGVTPDPAAFLADRLLSGCY